MYTTNIQKFSLLARHCRFAAILRVSCFKTQKRLKCICLYIHFALISSLSEHSRFSKVNEKFSSRSYVNIDYKNHEQETK